MFKVNEAEYVIYILVAASHEYVNTYSTRRVLTRCKDRCKDRWKDNRAEGQGCGPSTVILRPVSECLLRESLCCRGQTVTASCLLSA